MAIPEVHQPWCKQVYSDVPLHIQKDQDIFACPFVACSVKNKSLGMLFAFKTHNFAGECPIGENRSTRAILISN